MDSNDRRLDPKRHPDMTTSGVSSSARGNGRAPSDDPAVVWEALRGMTDAELSATRRSIAAFFGVDLDEQWKGDIDNHDNNNERSNNGGASYASNNTSTMISLHDKGGANIDIAPNALADAMLKHLGELVHDNQDDKRPSGAALESSNNGVPSRPQAFSLGDTADFPSLGANTKPNTAQVKATATGKPNSKRRITTTLISLDTPVTAVSLRPSGLPAPQNITETNNPWSKHDLLEKRMIASLATNQAFPPASPMKSAVTRLVRHVRPSSSKETPEQLPAGRENQPCWSPPPKSQIHLERKPPSICHQLKPKKVKKVTVEESGSNVTPMLFKPPTTNVPAARLIGFLISHHIVPDTCKSIQLLVKLLFRDSCIHAEDTSKNEFCHRDVSREFAVIALEECEHVLANLGADLIQPIVKCLEQAEVCEELSLRLKVAMRVREDRRTEESAKIGFSLPVETSVSSFRDYTLPFCEDVDSRLNYRTQIESVIYSNREKTRDSFLNLLRSFQKRQHSLMGSDQQVANVKAVEEAKALLSTVMPENIWWFARFFVLELVQVGSNPLGESDKELVLKIMEDKQVEKNPDRLRKLHRRFTSQKPSEQSGPPRHNKSQPPGQGSAGTVTGLSHTSKDKAARNQQSKSREPSNKKITPNSSSSALTMKSGLDSIYEGMLPMFSDNQAFFYHFICSCDSFQFTELVKRHVEGQFMHIWRSKTSTDPRKEFTETVLRLKVLAKFMGFLHFSPQWGWSSLSSALTEKNAAFDAAQREAIRTLEAAEVARRFDVLALVRESITKGKLAKCIPWLCDYLLMIRNDVVSSSMQYYGDVFMVLKRIQLSRRLRELGDTGLFIILQIEMLFDVLQVQKIQDSINKSDDRLRWCRALIHPLPVASSELDHLPFLYSKMFCQVCVGALDDLRGFIQTRANPRVCSGPTNRRQVVKPSGCEAAESQPVIRKVRPMQVLAVGSPLRSGALDTPTSTYTFDGPTGEPTNDPVMDALFRNQPQLKRAIDFVVEMVVTTVCEHVSTTHIRPRADELVDASLSEARSTSSFKELPFHEFQSCLDRKLETSMEMAIRDAVAATNESCDTRVRQGLTPLLSPSTPSQVLMVASKIATMRARHATGSVIARRLRAEFLKHVAMRKRVIAKDLGAAQLKGESESIVRALSFSLDSSGEESDSIEETFQELLQYATGVKSVSKWCQVAPFLRHTRSYRRRLQDLVEECGSTSFFEEHRVVLWSSIWRVLRAFVTTYLNFCVSKDRTEFIATSDRSTRLVAELGELVKLLRKLPDQDSMCRVVQFVRAVAKEAIPATYFRQHRRGDDDVDALAQTCARLYLVTHESSDAPFSQAVSDEESETAWNSRFKLMARIPSEISSMPTSATSTPRERPMVTP